MIWQNMKIAFVSIKSAKIRSFLTMLGVIIGVSSVLVMIAIGDGVKKDVTGQITDLGTNLLTVVSGKVGGGSSGFSGAASSMGVSTLTKKDVESIRQLSYITDVSTMNLISSLVMAKGKTDNGSLVIATDPSLTTIRMLKFREGGFFTDQDNNNQNQVVVLGAAVKKNLFGDNQAVGEVVKLRGQDFVVVGVVEQSNDTNSLTGASFDNVIYMPFKTGEKLTGSSQIFRIIAQVQDADGIDHAKTTIETVLKENHANQDDFSVLSQKDLVKTFSTVLNLLTSFVVAIASISLLVGGIGIMNIMLVSVSERTREIGIRKAIGATFGNILSQFLVEAVVLSMIGGVIGLVVAYFVGLAIKNLSGLTPVFTIQAVLLATGVSVIVGVVFGVAPAIKAARKNPITALKSI